MAFAFAYYILSFLISLINPFWGFVGFMCSLLLRFQDHYPEIVMIKPFTLLLCGMVLSCFIHKDKLSKMKWKQDKLILYMFLLSIFGLLIMQPSALITETYTYICSIAIYFFASRILQTPTQILTLFFFLALSVTYLGYLAIEDVNNFPKTTEYIDHDTGRWQGVGYYANSNEFGQLMITTIPFLLAAILIRKSVLLAALSISLMSVMIFVMIKSESRTVMVTLGLMFVGTFMLRGKGNIVQKAVVGGSMTLVMLTALTFTPGPIQQRMSTVLDAGNDESFQGRTRSWDYGFAMLSWYPITGVGKGQWIEYHGLMPHNSYVQVMAETGFFGIILFLWTIWRSMLQFKPIIVINSDTLKDPPKSNSLFGIDNKTIENTLTINEQLEQESENSAPKKEISNLERTVAIAGLVTLLGWLLYVFLGNQGYSVWMYFYLGLCASYANFLGQPDEEPDDMDSVFDETSL